MDSLLVLRMVEEQFHRDAEDDRPVREGRTPARFLREGDIEYKTCPYTGSRSGHPMNVSALRQMGARWDELVDALVFLRAAYTAARGDYGPDLMDVWRVSQLGSSLPWFHILRSPAGKAPAYTAALSKITHGTGIMAQRLYVKLLADRVMMMPLTAASLLAGAEETRTLVGETEACSASEKMIVSFLELFVEPAREPAGVGGVGELSRDAVLAFGAHYIALKHVVWMSFLARRFLYADLQAAIGPRAELQELIDAPCEPPDFFTVGPAYMAAVPPEERASWLRSLADLMVPLAPDKSDLMSRDAARALAAAMAEPPRADDQAAGALQHRLGIGVEAARRVVRAFATYGRIDAALGIVIANVEAGFRRTLGLPPFHGPIDAAVRDRIVAQPPRALFTSLAPDSFPGFCAP